MGDKKDGMVKPSSVFEVVSSKNSRLVSYADRMSGDHPKSVMIGVSFKYGNIESRSVSENSLFRRGQYRKGIKDTP